MKHNYRRIKGFWFDYVDLGSIVRVICPDGTIMEHAFPSRRYTPSKFVGYAIGWWISSNLI